MAISALAAIAAGVSAATAVGGTVVGSINSQNAADQQAQIAGSNSQNSLNQQQYQAALNALAMQRATAGSVDGRGNTIAYDPATNTWKTTLSKGTQAVQNASDQASISRNTTDLATSQEANRNSMLDAIKARGAAGPALAAIQNFRPMSSGDLEGALQQTATTANRQAEDPIIADTLRSFARTGTAAGPVLTNMMRDNATSLRQTMLNDKIQSMTNVGQINNTNRAGLDNTYSTLRAASNPSLSYAPITPNNPTDALAAEMTQRASGASTPASQGAYSSTGATGQSSNSAQYAAQHPGVSNLGASIVGTGDQLANLTKNGGSFDQWLNGGAGNAGDNPTMPVPKQPVASGFGQDPYAMGSTY